MSEKEKCFVFYQRWFTQICLLPKEDQLTLFKAICNYAFERKQDELNVYLEALMVNIRMGIDNDKDKQEAFLKLQKEKSIKAVDARKRYRQQLYGFSDNPTQPTGNPRVNSDNPTQPNNKNKNKNKNENENKNKNKNKELKQEQEDNNLLEHSSTSTQAVDADAATSQDKIKNPPPTEEEKERYKFYKKVAEFFNEKTTGKQIQRIKLLNSFRKAHIDARKEQYGEAAIFEVIEKATASNFLNGCGKNGFVATFDWLIRPNNFIKVLEGNYDNKPLTTISNGTNNGQQANASNGGLTDRQRRDLEFAKHAEELLKAANADTATGDVQKPLW